MTSGMGALLIAACLLLGAGFPAKAPARGTPEGGDVNGGRLVALPDGRRIYLECQGHGGPTVILISGFPNAADVWSLLDPGVSGPPVLAGVSGFTRVCAYDRPNTPLQSGEPSRSDSVPQPRTGADVVAELHALVRAAELPGPYILVGHSLGGMLARLYASTYPRQTAGIVEIDATYELLRDLTGPEFWPALARETSDVPPGFESYDLDVVVDQVISATAAQPLRPFLPLVVLSHGIPAEVPDPPPDGFPDGATLERMSTASQNALARILPYALHVIAERSGHYIQTAQPELVIDAVNREVKMVRPASVDCRGGASSCRAKVSLAGGASERKVVVRLPDTNLRLVSARPNRRSLHGTYGLSGSRVRRGGSQYVFRLDAAQSTGPRSQLVLTFRAVAG